MTCPKCKRRRLRQHVSVFVDCDADCHNLSKRGLRAADVVVLGADWPQAVWYCPGCGWRLRLEQP